MLIRDVISRACRFLKMSQDNIGYKKAKTYSQPPPPPPARPPTRGRCLHTCPSRPCELLGTYSPGGSSGDLAVRRGVPPGAEEEMCSSTGRFSLKKSETPGAVQLVRQHRSKLVGLTSPCLHPLPGGAQARPSARPQGPAGSPAEELGNRPGARPDRAQPPLGKVTVTPSGQSGKAPSEHGTTFQGQQVGEGCRHPSRRGEGQDRGSHTPPPHGACT